jgi:hypothetical protein
MYVYLERDRARESDLSKLLQSSFVTALTVIIHIKNRIVMITINQYNEFNKRMQDTFGGDLGDLSEAELGLKVLFLAPEDSDGDVTA